MSELGRLVLPPGFVEAISDSSYARLLGYPDDEIPAGPVAELAAASRRWYQAHGRPWAYARPLDIVDIDEPRVRLADGTRLRSPVLAERLRDAAANAVLVAAASAGTEVDGEATRLWAADRPDEAYALERFGVTVVEAIASWAAGELRRRVAEPRADLLPGYSPGYDGWPLADQALLFSALTAAGRSRLPGPLEVLESGMLNPKSSLLALFGRTPCTDLAGRAWDRQRCTWCSLAGCRFRRSRHEGPGEAAAGTHRPAPAVYTQPPALGVESAD